MTPEELHLVQQQLEQAMREFPQDWQHSLLFTASQMQLLVAEITELKAENARLEQIALGDAAVLEVARLYKENAALRAEIAQLRAALRDRDAQE
jgi:uncharacterized small protein (DUF1192 family)